MLRGETFGGLCRGSQRDNIGVAKFDCRFSAVESPAAALIVDIRAFGQERGDHLGRAFPAPRSGSAG